MEKYGSHLMPGTEMEKSAIYRAAARRAIRRAASSALMDMEHENAFSESDVRLLQTLANSMSVALENARLFDETQRRTRETAALAEVGRDISATLDLATVMDRIARHAKELLRRRQQRDLPARRRRTTAITRSSPSARSRQRSRRRRSRSASASSARSCRAVDAEFINDTGADPRAVQIAGTKRVSGERLMVAPLKANEVVKGVMAVWRTGGQPFDSTELEFLVGLSLQATVAIENARLFAESQKRAAELATVNTVSQQLSGKLDVAALLEVVGAEVRRLFDADIAYVALLEPRERRIYFPYQYGDQLDPIPYGKGLTSRVIESGEPLIINRDVDRQEPAP